MVDKLILQIRDKEIIFTEDNYGKIRVKFTGCGNYFPVNDFDGFWHKLQDLDPESPLIRWLDVKLIETFRADYRFNREKDKKTAILEFLLEHTTNGIAPDRLVYTIDEILNWLKFDTIKQVKEFLKDNQIDFFFKKSYVRGLPGLFYVRMEENQTTENLK